MSQRNSVSLALQKHYICFDGDYFSVKRFLMKRPVEFHERLFLERMVTIEMFLILDPSSGCRFWMMSFCVSVLLLQGDLAAQTLSTAPRDRIKERLDGSQLVRVAGNIYPLARLENDRGPVAPSLKLEYVTLHLKPTAVQQMHLDRLLAQQQDQASPNYRKWLTPEQYADRFGASPRDIAQIVSWLEGRGLTFVDTARGRNFVVFKGTARAVEAALHVEIHNYLVDGEMHYANSTEPSVPAAIRLFTIGFSGLDDFKPKPSERAEKPDGTFSGQHDLSAGDLWTVYDTLPFYRAGLTGGGMTLAVMGQSDVDLSDIAQYRGAVGLPTNPPSKLLVPNSANPGVVSGDSGESDLDLELAGAMVPDAKILFVYSTSVQNSVGWAIDNDVAPVISFSYGRCELNYTATLAAQDQQLAQQANVQGITWVASSGDSGSAGCDSGAPPASHGISVNLPASVPAVTAVGGTTFSEGPSDYWGSTGFAVSYIPEMAWNDTNAVGKLLASGGGVSLTFPRPQWQSSLSASSLNARLVPDVAMSASPQHDPYFTVQNGSTALFGGTSASAPVFAGVVLLLNQYFGANGLGNINPGLYALASVPAAKCNASAPTPGCVFHDITFGNNAVPCVTGANGCSGGVMGYDAGLGYDLVTGLGSVDAANLAVVSGLASPPSISSVTTAYGGPTIAQNTFIVIKGVNLVPASSPSNGVVWSSAPSFASGQMPTQLNGVSVTVNNKPAFVYFYCSAATDPSCFQDQLNVLTPLDGTIGPVSVVATSGTRSTPPFTVSMQAVAPSFLLISPLGYVTATHANYSLIGPAGLYPGYTTPAKPGEPIVLYAVGFGLPSTTLVNGSATQSGPLPVLPVCTVGGSPASLAFAGLISPGLYQLNLTIPPSTANGDDAISCNYNGDSTPAGDLITVQQ